MACHSPMPFAIRWKHVLERKRGWNLVFWITDSVYLTTGFHL